MEFKSYKECFDGKTQLSAKEQYLRAGRLADSLGITMKTTTRVESRDNSFSTKGLYGNKFEYKALGITTNENSSYVNATSGIGLQAAELQDIFNPVIFNALNEMTTFWNVVAKDDQSSMGGHRSQFVLKTAQNEAAGAYTGNALGTGNTTRTKYATAFKKYKCEFALDGDMIAAARGGPVGDVLALEVQDAAIAMASSINVDLFTEQGVESAAEIIGLKYLADATGNTLLYGVTRSSANKLAPTSSDLNYVDGSGGLSKGVLRTGLTYLKNDGSRRGRLVNSVQSHTS